jgi:hypothetical protein
LGKRLLAAVGERDKADGGLHDCHGYEGAAIGGGNASDNFRENDFLIRHLVNSRTEETKARQQLGEREQLAGRDATIRPLDSQLPTSSRFSFLISTHFLASSSSSFSPLIYDSSRSTQQSVMASSNQSSFTFMSRKSIGLFSGQRKHGKWARISQTHSNKLIKHKTLPFFFQRQFLIDPIFTTLKAIQVERRPFLKVEPDLQHGRR